MTDTGYLITFEGGEGGGKTTQTQRLKERLTAAGKEVLMLREPGGTNISEQIRQVVLSEKNTEMGFTTEVLLFQAARAQIYEELVIPALQEGKIVIMDRSRDSSVVYQGVVRGFGADRIEELNDISTKKTYPDLTFLLDVPVNVGLQRRRDAGEVNRIDLENTAFHEQVRQAYLQLAQSGQQRWQVIDASQNLEAVEAEIWRQTASKLSL